MKKLLKHQRVNQRQRKKKAQSHQDEVLLMAKGKRKEQKRLYH